jgi:hypothetical protein
VRRRRKNGNTGKSRNPSHHCLPVSSQCLPDPPHPHRYHIGTRVTPNDVPGTSQTGGSGHHSCHLTRANKGPHRLRDVTGPPPPMSTTSPAPMACPTTLSGPKTSNQCYNGKRPDRHAHLLLPFRTQHLPDPPFAPSTPTTTQKGPAAAAAAATVSATSRRHNLPPRQTHTL